MIELGKNKKHPQGSLHSLWTHHLRGIQHHLIVWFFHMVNLIIDLILFHASLELVVPIQSDLPYHGLWIWFTTIENHHCSPIPGNSGWNLRIVAGWLLKLGVWPTLPGAAAATQKAAPNLDQGGAEVVWGRSYFWWWLSLFILGKYKQEIWQFSLYHYLWWFVIWWFAIANC